MKTAPGASLEVVEPELFLKLLMRLLADPSRLYGGGQGGQLRLGGQVGEIVFPLPGRPQLADQPGFIPWEMLLPLVADPLRRSVGRANPKRSKVRLQLALRARAPADLLPSGLCQHVLGMNREKVGHVPLPRTPTGKTSLTAQG